jgi:hypothetical protein
VTPGLERAISNQPAEMIRRVSRTVRGLPECQRLLILALGKRFKLVRAGFEHVGLRGRRAPPEEDRLLTPLADQVRLGQR